ncbi:Holliday junction recognition protein [Athene noctua]|uniref:Holliday junction recognition protein n=1 Tax=Athene noctua TaxID=126797 RepID=UPI003EB99AC4
MDFDLEERLRQSNSRFIASLNSIVERYNHPFEDDVLISMATLTYDTPEGKKKWGETPTKKCKKSKNKGIKRNRGIETNEEMSKQQTSDFENGQSTARQVWAPHCIYCYKAFFTKHIYGVKAKKLIMNRWSYEGSDDDIVSLGRKFEDVHFQNLYVDNEKIQKKRKLKVDVIVQDNTRKIPEWITVAPLGLSKGLHLASPAQELIGNRANVCRKKELSSECSSRHLQLQFSDIPISPDTIIMPQHGPSPEQNKNCCNSTLEEYQSAHEECSWSSITLADLYPEMVGTLIKRMTKQSQRRDLKCMFGHLRHKKWCSRRPELCVTVHKIRGFTPLKLKKLLSSICSRSENIQNQTFGNENRELSDDECSINNFSGLVPYSYIDTSENNMDDYDSSLECYLGSGKGQKVSKQTVFSDAMAGMGKKLLVEDELQSTVSLKNSKCKESEKLAYKCFPECCSIISTGSSGSTALHLVKESKTQKFDFLHGDTSELCSSACSSYGNSNTVTPVANSSLARASNTLLINSKKTSSEREISFQHKHSFSSSSMKQSPSKMPPKYKDAFEKLYDKLRSEEIQKPLLLTRLLSNSWNLEERGRLVKSNSIDYVRSSTQCDREFDRIYEQLCSEAVPELPGFRRSLRKHEGIQMSETVNALVNSPVRSLSAFPRVKRQRNNQNDLLCSPVKRLRNIPDRYFPSTKCQQISQRKNFNLQTVDMDFLSIYNDSSPGFFDSHNIQSQDAGFHPPSDKTSLGIPGTSLQESGIADAHSGWPKATKSNSCPGSARKCQQTTCRKLHYTDGKD